MIPKIITPTDLRKNLADFLKLATERLIVVKDKGSNKVILDEREFNRLSASAGQFIEEYPEGEYRPDFENKILKRMSDNSTDESVGTLKDLL